MGKVPEGPPAREEGAIEIVRAEQERFGVKDIEWGENGVISLGGIQYRMVIYLGGEEKKDVGELTFEEKKQIIDSMKTIFEKAKGFRFTNLDDVKVTQKGIFQGERQVKPLDAGEFTTISTIVQNIFRSAIQEGKDKKEAEKKPKEEAEQAKKAWQEMEAVVGDIEKTKNLTRTRIYSDGNCLFAACLAGLKRIKKDDAELQKLDVHQFRQALVDDMRRNIDKNRARIQLTIESDIKELVKHKDNKDALRREMVYYGEDSPLFQFFIYNKDNIQENSNFDDLQEWVSEGEDLIEMYFETMGREGVYGGELELSMICDLYHVPIMLFSKDNEGGYDLSDEHPSKSAQFEEILHLIYTGRHYDLLVPKSPQLKSMPEIRREVGTGEFPGVPEHPSASSALGEAANRPPPPDSDEESVGGSEGE